MVMRSASVTCGSNSFVCATLVISVTRPSAGATITAADCGVARLGTRRMCDSHTNIPRANVPSGTKMMVSKIVSNPASARTGQPSSAICQKKDGFCLSTVPSSMRALPCRLICHALPWPAVNLAGASLFGERKNLIRINQIRIDNRSQIAAHNIDIADTLTITAISNSP